MMKCNVCDKVRSEFILNNKTVCFRCDELLFDIEIEDDTEPVKVEILHRNTKPEQRPIAIPLTIIKK